MRRATRFLVSLERVVRAFAAVTGGTIHETAERPPPRLVRRSRLYEATAKNLLRLTVELVGGVERPTHEVADEFEPSPTKLAVRKGAGNVVEPRLDLRVRLLAALAARGDRGRHARHPRLPRCPRRRAEGRGRRRHDAEFASVDDLLASLEGASGTTARLVDLPPLEFEPSSGR